MARYVYILRSLDADEHFAYGEVQTLGLEDVHLV